MSVVVVVVTARPNTSEVVVTIPTEVETPLNVDAASITTGVETVPIELPVVVSTTVTTLVTCDGAVSYTHLTLPTTPYV